MKKLLITLMCLGLTVGLADARQVQRLAQTSLVEEEAVTAPVSPLVYSELKPETEQPYASGIIVPSGGHIIVPGDSYLLNRVGKPGRYGYFNNPWTEIFGSYTPKGAYSEQQGQITRWFMDVDGVKTPLFTELPK